MMMMMMMMIIIIIMIMIMIMMMMIVMYCPLTWVLTSGNGQVARESRENNIATDDNLNMHTAYTRNIVIDNNNKIIIVFLHIKEGHGVSRAMSCKDATACGKWFSARLYRVHRVFNLYGTFEFELGRKIIHDNKHKH